MFRFLAEIVRSKYVRLLEEEVSRLRAENRALMNSLLGTAGFPPVEFLEAPKPQPLPLQPPRNPKNHSSKLMREEVAATAASRRFSSSSASPDGDRK